MSKVQEVIDWSFGPNLSDNERIMRGIMGASLVSMGLARISKSWTLPIVGTILGVALVYNAVSAKCGLSHLAGAPALPEKAADAVEEEVEHFTKPSTL